MSPVGSYYAALGGKVAGRWAMHYRALIWTLLATSLAMAAPSPSPQPSATPAVAGPCANPPLSSLAVRPGIGRAPATGGAVCVAPPGTIVIGAGYRAQVTADASARQVLVVYPAPVALVGLPLNSEVIVAPGLAFSHRIGTNGFIAPASGQQDIGIGIQHLLGDGPRMQAAVEVFATFPTGFPNGPSGFSAGAPTYQLAYTAGFSIDAFVSATLANSVLVSSGSAPSGAMQRYLAYQPSLTLSFALTPSSTLLLEDQIAAPMGPHGLTGNRTLIGLQQTLSAGLILDIEQEWNLLPPPGFDQHTTFEGGLTTRL
jgi:hypothetical protein